MQWLKEISVSLARGSDRRRAERVRNPAVLAYYSAGAEPQAHRVRDISSVGTFMYTEERWYLGTLVQVTLDVDAGESQEQRALASRASITVWAKVVRHADDGVGLEFVLVRRKRRGDVQNFVKRLKSRSI